MAEENKKNISRRKFMNLGVQGYAAAHLAGGIPASILSMVSCTPAEAKTVHGVCYHDCPDSCSWKVTVSENKVTAFGGNSDNAFTAGKLCDKMETFPQDVTYHSERLLKPLKRTGPKGSGTYEEISWEQGIREVAERLKGVVEKYGGESVYPFGYMGTQSIIQGRVMSDRFFTKLGASKMARTICGGSIIPGNIIANGQTLGILPEDVVHSRYIILWGTNTKNSNVHLWPFVLKARENGAKIIVIDPFVSATAKEADWHIQPMPGTDVALALGMMHIIIRDGNADLDYINSYTEGFDALAKHVESYDPETVSKICGLPVETIEQLSEEYANASPSLIRYLVGLEHNLNGGDAARAIGMLPSLIGAWREHGGGLLHLTYEAAGKAMNWERIGMHHSLSQKETRTLNMVELGKDLNTKELNPAVQCLFIFNANPMVSIPNQNLIRKGLEREDLFTVAIEHFMTDSAKYADYIFPATTQLEHWDIADSWGQIYVGLNQPAIKPLGASKPNAEFFRLLAAAMGYEDPCFSETDEAIARSFFETDHPWAEGITFDYLLEHGSARLKVPEPFLPHAAGEFGTESGKCEFYSKSLEATGQALPAYKAITKNEQERSEYPYQLLTVKKTKGFHNSCHANVKHLQKSEGEPTLSLSTKDAEKLTITEGDALIVTNQFGRVYLKARIDNRVRPGVVCMAHGYWPSLVKGNSSSNALTHEALTDIGGGAALQDCWVKIAKV